MESSLRKFYWFKMLSYLFFSFTQEDNQPPQVQLPSESIAPQLPLGNLPPQVLLGSGRTAAQLPIRNPPPQDSLKSRGTAVHSNRVRNGFLHMIQIMVPVTFCAAIFYSIPENVQERDNYENFSLYLPLLATIFLGLTTSFIIMLYSYSHSIGEVEENLQRIERRKAELFEVGLVFTFAALVLRVGLQLKLESVRTLVAYYYVGIIFGFLYLVARHRP